MWNKNYEIKKENGKEVVYERGILGGRKIGDLRETLSGGKVSTNIFGPKVSVSPQGFLSDERKATIKENGRTTEGNFRKGVLDNNLTFRSKYSSSRDPNTPNNSSSSNSCDSYTPNSSSSSNRSYLKPLIWAAIGISMVIGGVKGCEYVSLKTCEYLSQKMTPYQSQNLEVEIRRDDGRKYDENQNLEERVKGNLKQWLKNNRVKLNGNLEDYELISIGNINNYKNGDCYRMALVSPTSAYVLDTFDKGKTFRAQSKVDNTIFERIEAKKIEMQKRGRQKNDAVKNQTYTFERGKTQSSLPPLDPSLKTLLDKKTERQKDPLEKNQTQTTQAERKKDVTLPNYNWDVPKENPSLYVGTAGLSWRLASKLKENSKLKETLEDLVHEQTFGSNTIIIDYSQRSENLWVAGIYINLGKAFICYSPDNGKTFTRQWCSEPGKIEDVVGIYFVDSNEGWALLSKEVLHTKNKGSLWKKRFECKEFIKNLYILDKKRLVVDAPPYFYCSDESSLFLFWEKFRADEQEGKKISDELKENFKDKNRHYGEIYSKEE